MTAKTLSLRDAALALAVVAVWGVNFVVIRVALDALPPLLLAALRFTFVLLPAVFFLPRPATSWGNLAAYGVFIGVGQFGILFIAMNGMISPGLASLVVQMQVFFTIGLSMHRQKEKLARHQMVALAIAIAGIGVIMAHTGGDGGHTTTLLGLALAIIASFSWGIANQVSREAGPVNMLSYVVWASLFSVPPLFALSFIREGWPAISSGIAHAGWATWAAVISQSVGNTMFGYAVWAWLLSRYPAATVSPMSLLVPVFGMGAARLFLGESLETWKIIAALLVLGGLGLNLLWGRHKLAVTPPLEQP